jgi:hypothetical protein
LRTGPFHTRSGEGVKEFSRGIAYATPDRRNLLTPAALDAIRQWRYRPTLLHGEPVSVIMTVTVRFQLR